MRPAPMTTIRSQRAARLAYFVANDIFPLEEITKMQTRNVSLTAEQDAFIESVVSAGEYEDASEAIRDAIRALQHRRREDVLKLEFLRAQVKAGVDALDRGEYLELDDAGLDAYL
jgi:antitoxin ParD1/3/4